MMGSPRAAIAAVAAVAAVALNKPVRKLDATIGELARRGLSAVGAGLRRLASPYCAICRVEHGDPVCPGCLQDFFDPGCTRCLVCGGRLSVVSPTAVPPGARCGRCLAEAPAFDRTIVLGDYAPPLDGMIMALKSGGRLDLARVFGHLLAERIGRHSSIDCLLAVPLALRRQRQRGFNQSMQIAQPIARRLAVPLLRGTLVRKRAGPPQQSLPLAARRGNVRGAFDLTRPLRAPCVAVVDDVMTSGATLDEVARVLKRAGAGQVINLVVARTD
jgi:ComF family protein